MNRKFWAGVFIGVGVAIILFFGFRLAYMIRRGGFPLHPQPFATIMDVSLVREWMTIPYVAHMYGLPDQVLFDALEISEKDNHRKSLGEINEEYFPNHQGLVLERVRQAILAFQAHVPSPPVDLPVSPEP